MDIESIKKPFATTEVKTRKAGQGRQLKYADGATYVRRLNEVFGHAWDWTILAHERHPETDADGKPLPDELVVLGRLTVRDGDKVIVHEAFGGSTCGRGENLGDDLKSAATDALKKAASLLGIGLDLYTDVPAPGEETASATSGSSPKASAGAKGQAQASKGGAAAAKASSAKRSGEQAAKIAALLNKTKMPDEVFADKVQGKYGVAPEAMTVEQAAAAIAWLEDILAKHGKKAA